MSKTEKMSGGNWTYKGNLEMQDRNPDFKDKSPNMFTIKSNNKFTTGYLERKCSKLVKNEAQNNLFRLENGYESHLPFLGPHPFIVDLRNVKPQEYWGLGWF